MDKGEGRGEGVTIAGFLFGVLSVFFALILSTIFCPSYWTGNGSWDCSWNAFGSFIALIIGCIVSIPGIVCSAIGLYYSRTIPPHDWRSGAAIAGILISLIPVATLIYMALLF